MLSCLNWSAGKLNAVEGHSRHGFILTSNILLGCWDDEKMLDMGMLSAIKYDTGYVLLCSQEL